MDIKDREIIQKILEGYKGLESWLPWHREDFMLGPLTIPAMVSNHIHWINNDLEKLSPNISDKLKPYWKNLVEVTNKYDGADWIQSNAGLLHDAIVKDYPLFKEHLDKLVKN